MAKVPAKPVRGKEKRYATPSELLSRLQVWARERLASRVPSGVEREQGVDRYVEWLTAIAKPWRPRDDAREARLVSEQLLAALDAYGKASAASPGTSYFTGYVGKLASRIQEHLARHVAWLRTLEPKGKKAGRHGWDARTHLVMTVLQDEPNAAVDDLAAMTIAAGLLAAEDLQPLFGKGARTHGKPTETDGRELERKRIDSLIRRHRPLYRTSHAKRALKS